MVAPTETKLTPAMAQFHRWKSEYPDEILFFRMGDFFELFEDDAKLVSRELGIALTARQNGVPMAGVPHRSLDQYLQKLVQRGYRVAICDQIQDPKDATGVVERAVTRIVTAGTLTEEDLLDRTRPNYLAAAEFDPKADHGKGRVGLAFLDLSTGAFLVEDTALLDAADALVRRGAVEVLVPEDRVDEALALELKRSGIAAITRRPDWQFSQDAALEALSEQFGVKGTDGFGLDPKAPFVRAAGAALRYLVETQKTSLDHIAPPRRETATDRLLLDRATRSCLELTETAREGRKDGSLLATVDETKTAMGARRLREWILAPLLDVPKIHARSAAIAELVELGSLRTRLTDHLAPISDIERLLTRVVTGRANARDLVGIRRSLDALPGLQAELGGCQAGRLAELGTSIDPLPALADELSRALLDEPPLTIKEGGVIRGGYSEELDELRAIHRDGKQYLAEYQQRETERTGIQNLKVGFNRVFGFYIEITNSWKEHVPDNYLRKQTLKNAERYITPELKEYEAKVLTAEDRAKELEFDLFSALRDRVVQDLQPLQSTASALADVDALLSLAQVAALHGWCRPEVDDSEDTDVEQGRHPVVATALGASNFVPNDCRLSTTDRRLSIVTGPNMAGKSTYIRQVALIQILAQVGSFVPAKRARIGVADRVFARVGASDDLARGNSTFMVEMTETANILNNATGRSVVILDEVGRGTSTFDGMSLAWAISEHLLWTTRCRALFATHYHQLIELSSHDCACCNLTVAVREWGEEIIFLHQIVEGGSDRSYGIHVARLAGIPRPVLARAEEILRDLEKNSPDLSQDSRAPRTGTHASAPPKPTRTQQTLFGAQDRAATAAQQKLWSELREADPTALTPLAALNLLSRWKEQFGGG